MFRKTLCAAAVVSALVAVAPVAATVTSFGYDFKTGMNTAETGVAGNSITFTTKVNGTSINVTATGWNATLQTSGAYTGKYLITQAYLGQYDGGLGVTSAANDDITLGDCGLGQCNTHQIDNQGNTANSSSIDFVRLSFSAPVTIGSVTRYAYGSANAGMTYSSSDYYDIDDDFSLGKSNTLFANNSYVSSIFGASSLFQTNYGDNGSCTVQSAANACVDTTTTFANPNTATAATASQNWYVAASVGSNYGGDGQVDAFKLSNVNTYYYTASAVPESETWAMMIMGFGATGTAMRRRQRSFLRFAC